MSRIVERFEQMCRANADTTAVVYRVGTKVLRRSFAQLHGDVHSMRAYLTSRGVKQGDRILAFASSSYKLCVFMLAALETGASIMYVDIWAKQESLRSVFADYKPDMLLVSDRTKYIRFLFREINKVKNIINIDRASEHSAADTQPAEISEEAPALLTMTTGSTGKPKIAVRAHRDLMQQLELINSNLDAEGHQTVLTTSYIYIFANLLNGYTTVMPQLNLGRWSAHKVQKLLALFKDEPVSMIITSPDFCMKAEDIFPKLQTLYFGGAILNLIEARYIRGRFPHCKCRVIYGSTECSIIAMADIDELISVLESEHRSILGRAVNGVQVKLTDEGEILVTSEALLESYLVNDPSSKETDGEGTLWHHTNDIAEEENGLLYFLGKSRRYIELSGERVYSNCLEQRLIAELPDIPKCAVLQHKGKVYAVLQRGEKPLDINAVRSFLAEQGIPSPEIRTVKRIPCDVKHHTKINYDKLKEQL